jgi:hypothetical protein
MADKTLGQIGFEAYGDLANWTTYDGKPMPRWDDALRADIKEKWEFAAKAIETKVLNDLREQTPLLAPGTPPQT